MTERETKCEQEIEFCMIYKEYQYFEFGQDLYLTSQHRIRLSHE
jgi:hypothetical protein